MSDQSDQDDGTLTGTNMFRVAEDGSTELDDMEIRGAEEVSAGDVSGVADAEPPQFRNIDTASDSRVQARGRMAVAFFVLCIAGVIAGSVFWVVNYGFNAMQAESEVASKEAPATAPTSNAQADEAESNEPPPSDTVKDDAAPPSEEEESAVQYVSSSPPAETRVFAVMEDMALLPLAEAMEESPELVVLVNPEVFLGSDGAVQAPTSLQYPKFSGKPDVLAAIAGDGGKHYAIALEVGSDLDRDRAVQWAVSIQALGEQVNAVLLYSNDESILVDLVKGEISNPEIANAFDASMALKSTIPAWGRIVMISRDQGESWPKSWIGLSLRDLPPVHVHSVAEPAHSKMWQLAEGTGGTFLNS